MAETILLVDDTPANLSCCDTLSSGPPADGGRVGETPKPRPRGQADLILLDVMMPALNNFRTCRQLKGSQARDISDLRRRQRDRESEGVHSGAVDYIASPSARERWPDSTHLTIRRRCGLEQRR